MVFKYWFLSQIHYRVGREGALFLFGPQGMEVEQVTTAPVMATVAVYTQFQSAVSTTVEFDQNTWNNAPPHWQQPIVVRRQRRW